jgi:hypothetical protein
MKTLCQLVEAIVIFAALCVMAFFDPFGNFDDDCGKGE